MKVISEAEKNILVLSVVYSALELKKKLPLLPEGDDVFMAPLLDELHKLGYIEPSSSRGEFLVTSAGEALRARMVGAYDQLLKFEIFAHVNHTLKLTGAQSPDEGINVFDDILDPRFVESPESEDLRLAVLTWYAEAAAEKLGGKTINPHEIVFLQRLRKGHYAGKDFWFNLRLGTVFKEIDAVVSSAIKWTALDGENPSATMNQIYTAGMLEQVKRDGEKCSCGAHLGSFALMAAQEGKTLTECPSCQGSYEPPKPLGEMCPNCGHEIVAGQRKCRGCKAKINRSLAAGTVETRTTETTVEETTYSPWGGSYWSYGYYAPMPLYCGSIWYDPWAPIAGVASFGLVCAIL